MAVETRTAQVHQITGIGVVGSHRAGGRIPVQSQHGTHSKLDHVQPRLTDSGAVVPVRKRQLGGVGDLLTDADHPHPIKVLQGIAGIIGHR